MDEHGFHMQHVVAIHLGMLLEAPHTAMQASAQEAAALVPAARCARAVGPGLRTCVASQPCGLQGGAFKSRLLLVCLPQQLPQVHASDLLQPHPPLTRPHPIPAAALQGICIYHQNRLVKPFWRVHSSSTGKAGQRAAADTLLPPAPAG